MENENEILDAATTRSDEKSDEKRKLILAAAYEVFSLHSFKRTSMDDIAQIAGISRPALYQHFANKKAIFRSILESFLFKNKGLAEECLKKPLRVEEHLIGVFDIFVLSPHQMMEAMPNGEEILGLKIELAEDLFREWDFQILCFFERALCLEKSVEKTKAHVLAKTLSFAVSGMKTRHMKANEMEAEFKAMLQVLSSTF